MYLSAAQDKCQGSNKPLPTSRSRYQPHPIMRYKLASNQNLKNTSIQFNLNPNTTLIAQYSSIAKSHVTKIRNTCLGIPCSPSSWHISYLANRARRMTMTYLAPLAQLTSPQGTNDMHRLQLALDCSCPDSALA